MVATVFVMAISVPAKQTTVRVSGSQQRPPRLVADFSFLHLLQLRTLLSKRSSNKQQVLLGSLSRNRSISTMYFDHLGRINSQAKIGHQVFAFFVKYLTRWHLCGGSVMACYNADDVL